MFFRLDEFSKHVWVSGFRSKPGDVDSVLGSIHEKFPDVTVQLVDLDRVPGSRYILLAVLNALESFASTQPIAKTLAMEILLYVAADRQIGEAIPRVGISPGTERIAAILVGSSKERITETFQFLEEIIRATSDDNLVDDWSPERIKNVQSVFGIGALELQAVRRPGEALASAVERLTIERSALLTIRK